MFYFAAGAHPSSNPGDADQTVLPSSLGEECHLSVGLGAHGHHQGKHKESRIFQNTSLCYVMFITQTNVLSCSFMGNSPTISNCPNASWPSFTAQDTLIRSWCTRCGRKSWRKASRMSALCRNRLCYLKITRITHCMSLQCQRLFVFCLELGDTVAMSPVDRMKSLSLKLVSLGKIYAATPRYFPLGKNRALLSSCSFSLWSFFPPASCFLFC